MAKCNFCNSLVAPEMVEGMDRVVIPCPTCGRYMISRTAQGSSLVEKSQNYIVSAGLRKISEFGQTHYIDNRNIGDLVASVVLPKTPNDQLDLLIQYLGKKQPSFHDGVEIEPTRDYPIIVGKDHQAMTYVLQLSYHLKLVETTGTGNQNRLTMDGWARYELIGKNVDQSFQSFVAMWFDSSMDEGYFQGIKSALEELGYDPLRMKELEHNDKIDDRIIAEIRRSSLLIADLTGGRGGVYFEAGFAMGLGIPVIWTVRKDQLSEVHFDNRQYNFIDWETPDELKTRLIDRVDATIPRLASKGRSRTA